MFRKERTFGISRLVAPALLLVAANTTALQWVMTDCSERSYLGQRLASDGPSALLYTNQTSTISGCPQQASEVAQVRWDQWLLGRSSSYQFHFLDLLELLSRSSSDSSGSSLQPPTSH